MPQHARTLTLTLTHAQGAAADMLTEVVLKRMEAVPKLALIQQLGVVPVAAAWSAGLPALDSDPEVGWGAAGCSGVQRGAAT